MYGRSPTTFEIIDQTPCTSKAVSRTPVVERLKSITSPKLQSINPKIVETSPLARFSHSKNHNQIPTRRSVRISRRSLFDFGFKPDDDDKKRNIEGPPEIVPTCGSILEGKNPPKIVINIPNEYFLA